MDDVIVVTCGLSFEEFLLNNSEFVRRKQQSHHPLHRKAKFFGLKISSNFSPSIFDNHRFP